jgi:glutamate-ammonia-ligase adenylyltransferase
MISPVLWRENVSERVIREIRRIKARVESERIPSGEDPDYHLKLGPGGLSDIEFAVQLLQLRHGGQNTELRVTGTTNALARLHDAGIIGPADFASLSEAYEFLTRVRLRLHLQSGRLSDSLPTDPAALSRLASSLGFDRTGQLRETYRRHARKARRSFERLFFD